ncbi:MAG: cob(I)yrinic acid a,c-diamide adenosyltransferase [Planctomycetaceae bacterium]|nr:cob(I)yrinic acid a,c-diamide adenosyltransferase [Planctomycetaceae bacterium]
MTSEPTKHSTRILIFTGDGKGKTTAALGMVLRCCGHGLSACVVQFVKADAVVGEVAALHRIECAQIIQTGLGFLPPKDSPKFAEHGAAARAGLARAAKIIASGQFHMVVLDEVCFAVQAGLIEEADVIDAVRSAPPETCIVLTGRGATGSLIALADTVTEMRCIKHGMSEGWPAQKGVEK